LYNHDFKSPIIAKSKYDAPKKRYQKNIHLDKQIAYIENHNP
jgi:hypothetical protein